MNEKSLLALMYDFYNSHTLKGQNDDINYYLHQIEENNAKEVLVVGAGTGRVAIPVSKHSIVTALDFDKERLVRLKNKEKNINTICVNFLDYNESKKYDLIIIPYSTIQFDNNKEKLTQFFKKLHEVMNENTIVIFDVSESFNTKIEKNKEFLFKDYCNEINDEVEVFYSSKRFKDYIEFNVEYRICSTNNSVIECEKYYYYDKNLLLDVIKNNNLEVLKIDDGYGKDDFKHKHLYHCRRQI